MLFWMESGGFLSINLGIAFMGSEFHVLNWAANEDYIDFLLKSINKINRPEVLNSDQDEMGLNTY